MLLIAAGLANIGSTLAYLPLLSLILPARVEGIAGEDRIALFTACVLAGGAAASLSAILFGWLSDRSVAAGHGRRRWVIAGIATLALGHAAVGLAQGPVAIVAAVTFFQLAVNVALAPLSAMLAEEVPDDHKGLLGGLISLGYPAAAFFGAAVAGMTVLGEGGELALVVLAVAACMAPMLMMRRGVAAAPAQAAPGPAEGRRDLWIAWAARLLVQVASAVLSLYLLYYFESLAPVAPAVMKARIGELIGVAYLIPVPLALIAGRWSDRIDRRKPFLMGSAVVATLGLAGMVVAWDWVSGAIAYGVYALGSSVFLSLMAGFAMQLLPDPRHRGRDLGLINLANTLPILVGPALTWLLATPRDFSAALVAMAVLTLAGGATVLAVKGRR